MKTSRYVVVIRAGSLLRFLPSEELRINANIGVDKVVLTFRTRYSDERYESPIPRELWIDARGSARSLESAVTSFTNAANFFAQIIGFCANGYTGECKFHLAYDASPEITEREFFEQFIPDEAGPPPLSRRIDPKLTSEAITRLAQNPEVRRLRRAIVQYGLALRHWAKGEEILCVAHLFMGMESLVPLAVRGELQRLNLSDRKRLAEEYRVEPRHLDGTIRREILFKGDTAVHKAASSVSDGFEHGFSEFDEIREPAIVVRDELANLLREHIVRFLLLPNETTSRLLAKPYDRPIGTTGYTRYLRGLLIGGNNNLAKEDQRYPAIAWQFNTNKFKLNEDGSLTVAFSQSFTANIAEGVKFRLKRIEVYGPEGVVIERSEEDGVEPKIEYTPNQAKVVTRDEARSLVKKTLSKDRVKEIRLVTEQNQVLTLSRPEAGGDKPQQEEDGVSLLSLISAWLRKTFSKKI